MSLPRILAVVLVSAALYAAEPVHVVIMHTNDLHGHVLPGPGAGGSAALATIVRHERPDLMLDAGDSFYGTMISNMFEGAPMIEAMNVIGYDAAVLGNHEFNFGLRGLERRVEQAQFPFISANTNINVANIGDAAIFTAQGIRIAVIGLTTPEVMKTRPAGVQDVEVTDVVRGAEKALPRVRGIADFIVFLAHLRPEEELQLARAFPEVQLIISGHDHAPLEPALRVGNTMIVRTGSFGKSVGRVDLEFDGKKLVAMNSRLIPLEGVEADKDVQEVLRPYEARISKELDTVVGHAAGDMNGSLTAESHVGDLVADALRALTGTQITLHKPVRPFGIPKGPVTERLVSEVVPSDNSVVTMKLTGAQIKQILSRGVMDVSGLRVKYNIRKPAGKRLVSAKLADGKPLRDADLYTVTTTDGLDDLWQGMDFQETGILLREAVTEHIRSVGTIIPKLDGRIQVVN
jgi:5'-nucleotidase/UDP-sugar diphosphatase